MSSRHASAFAAILVSLAGSARAQSIRVADSLLNVGALAPAESIYYAAVRVRPRDPLARWALGRFLVERGATRVGVTLFEEAIQFGGEPAHIAGDLAPAYLALGMYHELAALPPAALAAAERERARWLDAHPTRLVAPDSMLTVSYRPNSSANFGRVTLRVNGHQVEATISSRVRGVVVSDTSAIARGLHHFDATDGSSAARPLSVPAAADSISIGDLTDRNFPIAMQSLANGAQAILGIDVLAALAPTFDPRAGRITLRVSGTVSPARNADVFPTLLTSSDLRILQSRGWTSASDAQLSRTLGERRWTLDARRGQVIIER